VIVDRSNHTFNEWMARLN